MGTFLFLLPHRGTLVVDITKIFFLIFLSGHSKQCLTFRKVIKKMSGCVCVCVLSN